MAAKVVVDSSVLVKWFKSRNEDLVAKARALLDEIQRKPLEVHVPALLLYEVGNILLMKTRLGPVALNDAIAHLEALPFSVAPPASPLLRRAAHLGRDLGLTFYDASFLALAVELDCPFITADRQLFEHPNDSARPSSIAARQASLISADALQSTPQWRSVSPVQKCCLHAMGIGRHARVQRVPSASE